MLRAFGSTFAAASPPRVVGVALQHACEEKKVARGVRTAQHSWGVGGAAPPPICKHNARMLGFKKCHMLSSKLAQAGVWGGGGAQQPPHLQTHRSHGEWQGFSKTQTSLRQHYLTTTVLTAVIVCHCHFHLHVHLHRHHQHVYVSMYECMYVYAMDVIQTSSN